MAAQPNSRPSERQRERNAELLCELLNQSQSRLQAHARRHAELPADAEDALQSAYTLFLERYNGLGEPLAWLHTTVKREAWGIRRSRSRRGERSVGAPGPEGTTLDLLEAVPSDLPGPTEVAEREELLGERRRALAALKPDERRALWFLGLGFSYVEICQTTGWTYTKVNRCVAEGRAALRGRP